MRQIRLCRDTRACNDRFDHLMAPGSVRMSFDEPRPCSRRVRCLPRKPWEDRSFRFLPTYQIGSVERLENKSYLVYKSPSGVFLCRIDLAGGVTGIADTIDLISSPMNTTSMLTSSSSFCTSRTRRAHDSSSSTIIKWALETWTQCSSCLEARL